MGVVWTIFVTLALVGVALLFIVDALQQRSTMATVAGLLALVAGGLYGAELWTPWVPLGVLALAFALGIAGRAASPPPADRRRA